MGSIPRNVTLAESGCTPAKWSRRCVAHLVQRIDTRRRTTRARVRLTPESASKTAIFEVSKANSIDCPIAALDAAGTLATNWFSRTSPSASSSSS